VLSSVRPGEGRFVASAFFALLGITAAHAMLETARDALFLAKLPTTHLTAMYLAIAGIGLLLSRLGGSRTGAKRVLGVASSLGLASLVNAAFWLALRHGSPPWLLYGLYIWTGTFASWLVLRFWLLLGAALTVTQARRLFGVIGTGSVLGAVLGAGMARLLVHSADVRVLLVASVVLLATALGPAIWLARFSPREPALAPDATRSSLQADLRLLRDSPYLSRMLGIILISTIALTIVDYLFKVAVAARGGGVQDMAAFLASTYFVLNVAALVVQSVGVGTLLRLVGVRGSFLVLPVVLVLLSGGLLGSGALLAALLLKGADGALRHSLHRTCVELLFVPLSDGARARAKPLVDLIGQRGGQTLASVTILLILALTSRPAVLELTLVLLCGAWVVLALSLRRHYVNVFRFALPGRAEQAGDRDPEVAAQLPLYREAAPHLDSLLYAEARADRRQGLDALLRLRRADAGVAIEGNGLRRALDRALRDAYASIDARLATTNPDRNAELATEQREATERVFALLSLLQPNESYDLIYRGLESEDARVHATSLELCENVCPRELRSALIKLVDTLPDEERLEGAAPYYVRPKRGVPSAGAAFAGQVLDDADFRGVNLRGVNLAGARLRGARFDGADLRSANLSGADARGAVFDRALLEDANLDATNFLGARGVGAVLVRCTGTSTRFESGNWSEADFSHCQLETPNFDNASLRGARFAHAKLNSGHFNASGLVDVVFDDANLEGARLTNTAVVRCSLERARLIGSHWELSGIGRSQFSDSHCGGMTWLRCDAKGVVFRASDLAGSTWKESKVRSSDFSDARWDAASLVDIDFFRTSFVSAKLTDVATTRLQLIACNLDGAETQGTVLPRNLLALLSRKHAAR
jgi:uncharacterized protein YjbI with pentapeptide repeats